MVPRRPGPDRRPTCTGLPRPPAACRCGSHGRHYLRRPVPHRNDRGRVRRSPGLRRDRPGPPRTPRQSWRVPGHHRPRVAAAACHLRPQRPRCHTPQRRRLGHRGAPSPCCRQGHQVGPGHSGCRRRGTRRGTLAPPPHGCPRRARPGAGRAAQRPGPRAAHPSGASGSLRRSRPPRRAARPCHPPTGARPDLADPVGAGPRRRPRRAANHAGQGHPRRLLGRALRAARRLAAQPPPHPSQPRPRRLDVIDAAALLADCKALVRGLVDDLRRSTGSDPETAAVVDAEYAGARAAGRTALAKAEWAEGLDAQVAVAWVLGCVFVRFCEDNGLVPDPLLAGPGGRRAIAIDHRTAYVQANPAHDDRHWLREIFRRYRALPATGEIFGDHNPIWLLAPSADGARSLVQGFQAVDPDTGEIHHDFTDPAWDTRFLGDLYQDLSDHAKKTYALLQTPEFVEEFILDRTLEPAIQEFGYQTVRLIDLACGSGHFLLGAFPRLFDRWRHDEPGTNPRALAQRTLDALSGVDLNPFAAAIARFRLLVAALRAGVDTRLADAPAYPIHVAVGDSLLHGDPPGRLAGIIRDDVAAAALHGYATEDVETARGLLSRSWHAVVGNPPYITVKDPALRELYRSRFKTCGGKYSLGVPFTERFFQLAHYDTD